MNELKLLDFPVPDNLARSFLVASGSSTLKEALDCLIETAKTSEGRSVLASKQILSLTLQLCQVTSSPLHQGLLFSSLKLLRNLCAGEIKNQDAFIKQNGAEVLLKILSALGLTSVSDNGIRRTLVQVLGNVSGGGEEHQLVIWHNFFPLGFLEIAKIRSRETCDPLCMIFYTCSQESNTLHADLCSDPGLEIMIEIIRTVTTAGFTEDWLKLLLSRICLEEPYFPSIFSKLSKYCDNEASRVNSFTSEQAFLLGILSKILNERISEIVVPNNLARCVFQILGNSIEIVDFYQRANSNLPTGSANVDVMGYSLTILRDICASPATKSTDELVSSGLIEMLLTLLRDLEPPEIIKKAMTKNEVSNSYKYCPYKGFRRDIVAIIGNCSYRGSNVQDKIRELDGIILLLQNCVIDDENPFLREWGMWTMHNILDGNAENKRLVAEFELQGTVDVPELTRIGLKVEVDPSTRRAKLVNVPGNFEK